MATFGTKYRVGYSEVDYFGTATPVSILNYLQEAAFDHSDDRGMTPEVMASLNETWMIYKWYVEIYRYPCWKDYIQVTTWLSSFKSRGVMREFQIHSQEGELLGSASTQVLLVDTEKGRPKRIHGQNKLVWEPEERRATSYDFANFNLHGIQPSYQKHFVVTYHDIDSNAHVNNAHYLRWFLESVPAEVHQNYRVGNFEIIYRNQLKLGEKVMISTGDYEKEGDLVYISEIQDSRFKAATLLRASFTRR
ncbi:acyl-[acyl-carrier-protein] thioesterase [Syntrophomonas erecta]